LRRENESLFGGSGSSVHTDIFGTGTVDTTRLYAFGDQQRANSSQSHSSQSEQLERMEAKLGDLASEAHEAKQEQKRMAQSLASIEALLSKVVSLC
jgi:hypothetical protein